MELSVNDAPKTHFIGSIVTMPTMSVPEGVAKYLLIDGQQRLTTIFVVLTLLRDTARSQGDMKLADKIEQTMLVNHFENGNDYLKILPTKNDRVAFSSLIQQERPLTSHQLHLCYQFFESKLNSSIVDVQELTKVLNSRLSVVSIVLDLDDNPHLVFESLNAKGLKLTQADLIRNYFFMRIHVHEQDKVYAELWEPMQRQLTKDNDNLTDFIRHYMMKEGERVKESEVYFALKERVDKEDPISALKMLSLFSEYYRKILDIEEEDDPKIRRALLRLNRLEVTTVYPFLLNCYHDYARGDLSPINFLELLQMLENFMIRRFVCNKPTSMLNKIFPSLYKQAQATNSASLVNGVRVVLQDRGYPTNEEFHRELVQSRLYATGERASKTRLILESLELAHQHKERVPFGNQITIEHIMPQTLTGWWEDHMGDEWQDTHELYLHTLGNLTLTGYNSELSNDTFPQKQQRLMQSHFEMNRYFQATLQWKRQDIEDRSKVLADLALTVWPYFGTETITRSSGAIITKKPKALRVLGQSVTVESWIDVLVKTLSIIAEQEPDLFMKLTSEFPRFISADAEKFKRKRQLGNGYYVDTNLIPRYIYRFCTQAMESIGFSAEDWVVDTE